MLREEIPTFARCCSFFPSFFFLSIVFFVFFFYFLVSMFACEGRVTQQLGTVASAFLLCEREFSIVNAGWAAGLLAGGRWQRSWLKMSAGKEPQHPVALAFQS